MSQPKSETFGQVLRAGSYLAVVGLIAAAGATGLRASATIAADTDAVCRLKPTEQVQVAEVLDGDTVVLSDKRRIRLTGIEAPQGMQARTKMKAQPLSSEAKEALQALTLNQKIGLAFSTAKQPDKGRLVAHLFTKDSVWVQGKLVSDGLARAYAWPDNLECSQSLLTRENASRIAKRGIWAKPFYAIRTPLNAETSIDSFQIVEGVIVEAANIKGRIFLNFGEDYRSDFTVHVKPTDVEKFATAGMALEGLAGKRVRVRGWLREKNGPVITATHPGQIEILSERLAQAR